MLSDLKSEVLKKSKKIDILQTGYSMVFLKEIPFSSSVLLSKESQKETFFDLLNSEKCFLDLKSEVLAKSKKSTFCKGVSSWFLSKNRPFSYMLFYSKKSQKETFFYILDRKYSFLDLKS